MLSIQLFQAIVDERERTIQDHLREQRLLREAKREPEPFKRPERVQPEAWRARTPRASVTTR